MGTLPAAIHVYSRVTSFFRRFNGISGIMLLESSIRHSLNRTSCYNSVHINFQVTNTNVFITHIRNVQFIFNKIKLRVLNFSTNGLIAYVLVHIPMHRYT